MSLLSESVQQAVLTYARAVMVADATHQAFLEKSDAVDAARAALEPAQGAASAAAIAKQTAQEALLKAIRDSVRAQP